MAMKKCCIQNCNSCSTRTEDIGVTYHKYPKDLTARDLWKEVTQVDEINGDLLLHVVCSRHFCKSDFQSYEDSKYVLKSDAVPSIFPWTIKMDSDIKMQVNEKPPDEVHLDAGEKEEISLNDSKETEGNKIEAIKKFIEEQEKEILELQAEVKLAPKGTAENVENLEPDEPHEVVEEINNGNNGIELNEHPDETLALATSVIDIILSESEAILSKNDEEKKSPKTKEKSDKGGNNSMALSVGSKVEAKDFSELWYPAQIVEVDYEEMEVLVRYDNVSNKHDEWINVSSPRLRPFDSPRTPIYEPSTSMAPTTPTTALVKEEPKVEEKVKIQFKVGDRCLARWRDNRRFMATVHAELNNGKYEVVFDDGVHWTCGVSRLSKFRETSCDVTSLPVESLVPSSGLSPLPYPAPSPTPGVVPGFPFHTHLFDPARDYLGSKSERREKKRKLNIKEIFNIGQKRKKETTPQQERPKKRPRIIKKEVQSPVQIKTEVKTELEVETEPKVEIESEVEIEHEVEIEPELEIAPVVKTELPDAVASIIGSVKSEESEDVTSELTVTEEKVEVTVVDPNDFDKNDDDDEEDDAPDPIVEAIEVKEEDITEVIPEENTEDKQNEVITDEMMDKISETITKLENTLGNVTSPKPCKKQSYFEVKVERDKKKHLKLRKAKRMRLLHEKRVKEEVEKVKKEMEMMKSQLAEMKKLVGKETEELYKTPEKNEAQLLPGEWSCKWVNGQPVGTVSEIDCDVKDGPKNVLPRRSVQVEDLRLPPGWTKHMVRRSQGSSAGKWNVVLVSPDNKRLHTKTDMLKYMETLKDKESLKEYEFALLDFGMHRKLARRLGWDSNSDMPEPLPVGTLCTTSPIVKQKRLSLKRKPEKSKGHKISKKERKMKLQQYATPHAIAQDTAEAAAAAAEQTSMMTPLEDGYVYVGSLKVQIIENLLRCPAEGCYKNFRNNTLLQMHIKHYHRELRKMLGATPKVSDLAYARAEIETDLKLKMECELRVPKLKISKKRLEEPKIEPVEPVTDLQVEVAPTTPVKEEPGQTPKPLDSPRLRNALVSKPVKRPRVLLPVKKSEEINDILVPECEETDSEPAPTPSMPMQIEQLDFESEISSYTLTRPMEKRKKGEKKKMTFASVSKTKPMSEDEEEWATGSDGETRHSFPRSGSSGSKYMDKGIDTPPMMPVSSESTEDQKEPNIYMYTETGERVKIVHMKREEIINCHCGFREEDGLMIQCELCLCWQHAVCHNIQREAEVPEKYTCSICLNPRRGRRSQRFLHDQDRLYEGLLPGARPCESLKRSHELSGNLLRIQDALHALTVKYYVANKKDHPKLYLWAKDWDTGDLNFSQEKLNADYVDLNMMISAIGKENLPIKAEDINNMTLAGIGTPSSDDPDNERYVDREGNLGSQALLSGLLSSPGGASLDLPISTSDLERLAKSVQEAEIQRLPVAPQPAEAAIENSACRERLLRHISRCQALVDARLDSIEAQVAELESQDPSFEDDETADFFPRTKQTVQMLLRDLEAMEELGVIT